MVQRMVKCLTIAGSDSGGGAGIQGDLKTFTVLGAYGMSAITALTAQNTLGVSAIHEVPSEFVREQIRIVLSDLGCDAAKTGMLANQSVILVVAEELAKVPELPVVVDPVMVSTTGARLLAEDAIDLLREKLVPRATLVTPNCPEAAILANHPIQNLNDAIAAARRIAGLGPSAVLVKGGDATFDADVVTDVLCIGDEIELLRAPRIATRHTHGSGCALSSAICVGLARGMDVREAVAFGRTFIRRAIEQAVVVGQGASPVNHLSALSS
ncbi:MAG: bifunctional hydroxymethylpyrimidine kinase/phosphomethylpyrimidine kinase [Candidatus Hydrogenedentota bacterium]|nr:MAG: bifunctional hydroxymethylpyrimidine kinase/phosphomethylpyrimidine kinase [Candidatus Hydrogenedentota bacterium]GIX44542.1 MAG: hydroxymethylpyrimidine/phosphomethylpyrimidine kinase [Candidatus Sumerlaea sp.]